MKTSAQKGNTLIPIIFAILIASAFFLFLNNKTPTSPSQTQTISIPTPNLKNEATDNKSYTSKALEFTIKLPSNFEVEEKFTSVSLKNNDGQIILGRSGTNFEKLEDHLKFLEYKNNLDLQEKNSATISGNPSSHGFNGKEKIYFIMVENAIYSLSTSSPELYDDLDQIANSFQYTP